MQKYYGTGMIGLDMKPKRKVRNNKLNNHWMRRWLMPVIIVMAVFAIFIVAGAR